MLEIHELRKAHGGVYVTVLPDGRLVPWKPLSMHDWIRYSRDYTRALIPDSHLEDEIFRKCVLDDSLVRQLDFLSAGIVTAVVVHIWQHSGPVDTPTLISDLETSRAMIHGEGLRAVHELVQLITMAFPYKPEEVYAFDYETFMFRVAQAEEKLLAMGMIQERIVLKAEEQADKPEKPKIKVDAKKAWEIQEKQKALASNPMVQQQKQDAQTISRKKWWDASPVLEADSPRQINVQTEGKDENNFILDNHDLTEPAEMQKYLIEMKSKESRDKMIQDAQWIYKDLIETLEKKKVTNDK